MSKKEKKNCLTCSNRVGQDYCTMQKDMNKAMYKSCDGWVLIPKPKKREVKRKISKEYIPLRKRPEECNTPFLKFCRDGGSFSFRTNSFLIDK